jgi:hypothetical protein
VHDFRLAALGLEPHVAERCLNHKLEGVEGVYNRRHYFEERRRALQAWGQLLLKLESGDATAKNGKAKADVARGSVTDQSLSA